MDNTVEASTAPTLNPMSLVLAKQETPILGLNEFRGEAPDARERSRYFEFMHKLPTIQNLVATTDLQAPVDLRKLAQWCRNAEFNPKRFSGLIMRCKEPKCTGLVFQSGKIVVTGAKSEREAMTGS